jgi:hypothetical protein
MSHNFETRLKIWTSQKSWTNKLPDWLSIQIPTVLGILGRCKHIKSFKNKLYLLYREQHKKLTVLNIPQL